MASLNNRIAAIERRLFPREHHSPLPSLAEWRAGLENGAGGVPSAYRQRVGDEVADEVAAVHRARRAEVEVTMAIFEEDAAA